MIQARSFQDNSRGVVCRMGCDPCELLDLEHLYKDELLAGEDLLLMYHGGMCKKLAIIMIVQKAESESVAAAFVERFLK